MWPVWNTEFNIFFRPCFLLMIPLATPIPNRAALQSNADWRLNAGSASEDYAFV